jgi:alpha-glucosidase (family GH31 glycosyl hydrolase)
VIRQRTISLVLKDSPGVIDFARRNRLISGNGYEWHWWKGTGGFIDYSNPGAMHWWHDLQNQMLDWGIDGWKLDGCDTFFSSRLGKVPLPFNRVASGWMTTRQYMDHYARDEYRYGLSRNPQFAILVRALDHPWFHPEGFSPLDAATVTWVGDNRHTWGYKDRGFQAALTDILRSASLGYCVIGSDVAGYHGRGNPDDLGAGSILRWSRSKPAEAATTDVGEFGTAADNDIGPNLYIRWAEFSTFCGLFLNGGHGERRLWKRSWPELEVIRKFCWLHTELVPYTYSQVVECHRGGLPLMRPLSEGKFHYLFGNDLLVAPIYADKLEWDVSLPAGRWRYFFEDNAVYSGQSQVRREYALDEFPVFVREGAIIPLNVARSYTGLGDTNSTGFTTWLVYPYGKREFTLWHPESHPEPESTTLKVESGSSLKAEFTGKHQPHILRILMPGKPTRITLDGSELSEGDSWHFDGPHSKLIIKTRDYVQGKYEIFITTPR